MFRNAIKKKRHLIPTFSQRFNDHTAKKKRSIKGIFLHIIEYFIQYRCISDKNVSIIKKKKDSSDFRTFFCFNR